MIVLDGKLLCTGRGQRRPCVQLLPRQPPALQRQVVQGIGSYYIEILFASNATRDFGDL